LAKRQRKGKRICKVFQHKKQFRMKYGGSHGVSLWFEENPRKGICQVCGKSAITGELKFTNIHHFFYQWRPQTVKDNPSLALLNCCEVCYYDHNWLDALRVILSVNENRFLDGIKILPKKSKDELAIICKLYLEHYE
jgi:hypothetical protein